MSNQGVFFFVQIKNRCSFIEKIQDLADLFDKFSSYTRFLILSLIFRLEYKNISLFKEWLDTLFSRDWSH